MAELKITTPFIVSAPDYHDFEGMQQTLRNALLIPTDKPGCKREPMPSIAFEELNSPGRDYHAVFYIKEVDDISGILEEWNSRDL